MSRSHLTKNDGTRSYKNVRIPSPGVLRIIMLPYSKTLCACGVLAAEVVTSSERPESAIASGGGGCFVQLEQSHVFHTPDNMVLVKTPGLKTYVLIHGSIFVTFGSSLG